MQRPVRNRRPSRGKVCRFCADKIDYLDYKDLNRLRNYITDRGKILPRRVSGNCARHQHQLTEAVKRCRNIAMLPYVAD